MSIAIKHAVSSSQLKNLFEHSRGGDKYCDCTSSQLKNLFEHSRGGDKYCDCTRCYLRGMQEAASDTSGSKDGILGSLGEISTSANPSLNVIRAWTIPI